MLGSSGRVALSAAWSGFAYKAVVDFFVDWLDRSNCANAEGLAAVVKRHPQIERILCGHVHRAAQIRFAGTLVSTAPSTAYQVALELGHDGEAHLIANEPPAFLLHRWHGGALVTHVVPVGDFGAPEAYG